MPKVRADDCILIHYIDKDRLQSLCERWWDGKFNPVADARLVARTWPLDLKNYEVAAKEISKLTELTAAVLVQYRDFFRPLLKDRLDRKGRVRYDQRLQTLQKEKEEQERQAEETRRLRAEAAARAEKAEAERRAAEAQPKKEKRERKQAEQKAREEERAAEAANIASKPADPSGKENVSGAAGAAGFFKAVSEQIILPPWAQRALDTLIEHLGRKFKPGVLISLDRFFRSMAVGIFATFPIALFKIENEGGLTREGAPLKGEEEGVNKFNFMLFYLFSISGYLVSASKLAPKRSPDGYIKALLKGAIKAPMLNGIVEHYKTIPVECPPGISYALLGLLKRRMQEAEKDRSQIVVPIPPENMSRSLVLLEEWQKSIEVEHCLTIRQDGLPQQSSAPTPK